MTRITNCPATRGGPGAPGNFVFPRRERTACTVRPPKKPRCTALLARTRSSFSSASALWKKTPLSVRQTWQSAITDSGMTLYNVYLAENAVRIREGEPALICPGSGISIPKGLCAGSMSAGTVSIWSEDPIPVLMSVFAQKIENGIGGTDVVSMQNLTYEQIASVSGFVPGTEYFLYCIITDLPVECMTRCSASASFRVLVK